MKGKLYIVTGASGSGKTTLLNSVVEDNSLNIIKAPKYADRKIRNEFDDIIHYKPINKENFDIVYKLNKKTYGLKLNEIKELLKQKNLLIILSDIRVIKRLKSLIGKSIVTIYLSSAIDADKIAKIQENRYIKDFSLSKENTFKLYQQFNRLKSATDLGYPVDLFRLMRDLLDDWKTYLPESESTEIRMSKIRDFHKAYIDNISIFDHVVLNYKDPKEMFIQTKNILDFYRKNGNKEKKKKPVVFIVSAASGSGKGMLMESIRDVIGIENIHITSKKAKREKKNNDKRDGMIAIGRNGVFGDDYNIRWSFHKGNIHKGTEYAVSENEIMKMIKEKKSQIFVSNIQQIDMFEKLLKDNAVFIYLHATRSPQDIQQFQYNNNPTKEEAEQKIKEIDKVYYDYVNNISKFDHLLLNTAYPEDLYEQIFKLIDYYS